MKANEHTIENKDEPTDILDTESDVQFNTQDSNLHTNNDSSDIHSGHNDIHEANKDDLMGLNKLKTDDLILLESYDDKMGQSASLRESSDDQSHANKTNIDDSDPDSKYQILPENKSDPKSHEIVSYEKNISENVVYQSSISNQETVTQASDNNGYNHNDSIDSSNKETNDSKEIKPILREVIEISSNKKQETKKMNDLIFKELVDSLIIKETILAESGLSSLKNRPVPKSSLLMNLQRTFNNNISQLGNRQKKIYAEILELNNKVADLVLKSKKISEGPKFSYETLKSKEDKLESKLNKTAALVKTVKIDMKRIESMIAEKHKKYLSEPKIVDLIKTIK